MTSIRAAMFATAVTQYFSPLATKWSLAVRELGDGVCEIRGGGYAMRIRRGTGHRNDILVTIVPEKEVAADHDDIRGEIGLGVVAEFCGQSLNEPPTDTEEQYMRYVRDVAEAAGKFLLPYLRGEKSSLVDVRRFLDQRAARAAGERPDWNFPKNVKRKWT